MIRKCSRCERDMSRYKFTCGVRLCNNCRYEVSVIEEAETILRFIFCLRATERGIKKR